MLRHEGENTIEIHFLSPIEYVKSKQSEAPLPPNANGIDGVPYIRKPACHFGWDWGINMPVSGIFGNIEILFYNNEIRDFWVRQEHSENGEVKLYIKANKAVRKFHVGSVVEYVKAAGNIQLQCRRDTGSFRLRLS